MADMDLAMELKQGLAPLVDLLYPPRCPLCGDGLGEQGGLCVPCWSELEMPGLHVCGACQKPLPKDETGEAPDAEQEPQYCDICYDEAPLHDGIAAGTIYNAASRKLILSYKHGKKIALAPMLARIISARLEQHDPDQPQPLLIPVPLHPVRMWKRGFNQSALLARELAKLGKGELLVDGLVRRKMTPSLGGLGQHQRETALNGAIKPRRSRLPKLSGRDVILVDDVLTSGATSDACIRALRDAGAETVRIACFARVVEGFGVRD
ncbi:MAG: ComF family protein [Marinomonas sp.]